MPIGDALINAGSQLFGGLLNNASTSRQNRKSREWSDRYYQRQYDDSIAFWNMQNAYNTPQEQMHRFKEAGLNPNLIYGQGNSGNAGSIPTPSSPTPEFRSPDFSPIANIGSSYLAGFYDLELKKAQRDNLLADNTVKLEEAALKEAQRASTNAGTARSKFDLDLDTELRQVSADARRQNLLKLRADTDMSINENERRTALNTSNLLEAKERILNLRAIRYNISKDSELKQLDIELKRNGIQPSDPLYSRILSRAINAGSGSDESWWSQLKSWWNK